MRKLEAALLTINGTETTKELEVLAEMVLSNEDSLPEGWVEEDEGGYTHEESGAFVILNENAKGYYYYQPGADYPSGHVSFDDIEPVEYETEDELWDVAREYAMNLAVENF